MKKFFYIGLAGIALVEIMKVYFIMPMPGSQEMDSLDAAYFIYSYRWFFRIFFAIMIIAGSVSAFALRRKWIPAICSLLVIVIIYFFNFPMIADGMFKQPKHVVFKARKGNALRDSTVVIGVVYNGEAKAYPIRFLVYHHQVQDSIGGKPFIITYCSVCRTGRVFEPTVNNHNEKFRLVGMDHFNAMFEDSDTKSWWRQATGEAVAGPLKGHVLPEVQCVQNTLGKWFQLYPDARVMQMDGSSKDNYDLTGKFERGESKGSLTRTDSLSWKNKSWVVGINLDSTSKAYDWNTLKEMRIINDKIGNKPIVLALSQDNQSFAAFERLSVADNFSIRNDTLISNGNAYDFAGRALTSSQSLKKVKAYQEFWHSWRTFHPRTLKY